MKASRDLILKSLTNNLDKFLVKLSDIECINLSDYLGYNFMKKTPNKIQEEFIEEFFTLGKWLKFYQQCKRKEMGHEIYFSAESAEPEFWNEIRTHILFHVSFLYKKHLAKQEQEIKRENKLKKDLNQAILNSKIDGLFDKCEGWLNVSEILEKYKLIELDKY